MATCALRSQCPYGEPGDRLWVKETHTLAAGDVLFRATDLDDPLITPETKWKPSIFMRRKYSRITLEITAVRVERLQEITERDAEAEGIDYPHCSHENRREAQQLQIDGKEVCYKPSVLAYRDLWESINGPESWAANPWVWVVEFEKL